MANATKDVRLDPGERLPRLKFKIGHAQKYTFDAVLMATEGATIARRRGMPDASRENV